MQTATTINHTPKFRIPTTAIMAALAMLLTATAYSVLEMHPTQLRIEQGIDISDLPSLEGKLEQRLREVREGLPLTPEQAEQLGRIYNELKSRGGMANGIISRILQLIKLIMKASIAMELQLEHQQNGHQDDTSDDIPGVAR